MCYVNATAELRASFAFARQAPITAAAFNVVHAGCQAYCSNERKRHDLFSLHIVTATGAGRGKAYETAASIVSRRASEASYRRDAVQGEQMRGYAAGREKFVA